MKNSLFFLLLMILSCQTYAQDHRFQSRVNTRFELHIDSLSRAIAIHKQAVDTFHVLHHTIKNTSADTLTYVTNSCFYYNHFTMEVGGVQFEVNESGGCLFNEQQPHQLAPGESVHISEWVSSAELNQLKTGESDGKVIVPLIQDNEHRYRVDGRYLTRQENGNNSSRQEEYLIFEGRIKVVETVTETPKRKKNRKSKTKRTT